MDEIRNVLNRTAQKEIVCVQCVCMCLCLCIVWEFFSFEIHSPMMVAMTVSWNSVSYCEYSSVFHNIKEKVTRSTESATLKNMSINIHSIEIQGVTKLCTLYRTAPVHRTHTQPATKNAISEIWPYQCGINCNHEALFSVQSTAPHSAHHDNDMRIIVFNVKVNGKLYCHTEWRWPNWTNERCITFHFLWASHMKHGECDWESIKAMNISHLVNSCTYGFGVSVWACVFLYFPFVFIVTSRSMNTGCLHNARHTVYSKNVRNVRNVTEIATMRLSKKSNQKWKCVNFQRDSVTTIFLCLCSEKPHTNTFPYLKYLLTAYKCFGKNIEYT